VVQFEEGEVDTTYPIVQPRGRYPDIPPGNGAQVYAMHHEMGTFADPRNGVLHYALIGAANPGTVTHDATGMTRLAYFQNATSWASITEWKDSQTLLIDPSWPLAEGGNIAHYVSVAAEIRAAGTNTDIGRIRDRSLASGASTTDGTVFTVTTNINSPTNVITSFRERDVWLAVTSSRTGATPGQPTITSTLGWTWDLASSVAYNTIASSTQKLWLFHTRIGITDPGSNVITITYPQTQTAAAWQVSETRFTNDTSARLQTKTNRIDASGAAGFTTTFDNPTEDSSAIMFFLAKADYDHTSGVDVLPGVIQEGFVEHEQATVTTPGLSISAFACHTHEDAPTIALWQNADAAMIAVEFGFNSDTSLVVPLLDATPSILTPGLGPTILPGLISHVPQLFTPTRAAGQQIFGGGAFQEDAFQDDAFQIGTGLFVDHTPVLYEFTFTSVTTTTITVPSPATVSGAFQTDTFQDDAFQQFHASSGINHEPSLLAPSSIALTATTPQFVYLTGIGGWDSDEVLWDTPSHVWDEGNIGGLVQHTPQLFTPTAKQKVTVPLLDAVAVLYTPTTNPSSLVVPLISHVPGLFTPMAKMQVYQADTIDAAPVILGFSIQGPIEFDIIDASPELYTPTTNPSEIDPPLISHIPGLFTPTAKPKVSPGLIDATPTLYVPALGPVLYPDVLDATPTLYTPSLERIIVDLLDAIPEILEPQKVNIPFAQIVRLDDSGAGLIDISAQLFDPDSASLGEAQVINCTYIDESATVFAPRIFHGSFVIPVTRKIATFQPVLRRSATFQPILFKEASLLGVKSPITEEDAWFVGEDQTFEFLSLTSGRPDDVTGWTIQFRMATAKGEPSILTISAVLSDPTDGEFQIVTASADTASLEPETYYYDVSRLDSGSNQVLAFGDAVLQARVS